MQKAGRVTEVRSFAVRDANGRPDPMTGGSARNAAIHGTRSIPAASAPAACIGGPKPSVWPVDSGRRTRTGTLRKPLVGRELSQSAGCRRDAEY